MAVPDPRRAVAPTDRGMFHLRDQLTEAFRRMPTAWSPYKHHAFVAVGWVPADRSRTRYDPFIVTVSNYATNTQGVWLSAPEDEFTLRAVNLREHQPPNTIDMRFTYLQAAGQGMKEPDRLRLTAQISRVVDRTCCRSGVRLLAEEMRRRSAPTGPVGDGQLITVVPHPRLIEQDWLTLTPAPPMIGNARTTLEYFTTAWSIPSHCMSFILIPDDLTKPEWPPLPSMVDLKGRDAGWTWADFLW